MATQRSPAITFAMAAKRVVILKAKSENDRGELAEINRQLEDIEKKMDRIAVKVGVSR